MIKVIIEGEERYSPKERQAKEKYVRDKVQPTQDAYSEANITATLLKDGITLL